MQFANDEEVKVYIGRQLAKVSALPDGPFYSMVRPQWRYRDLPSSEMGVGHLEWKIYRKADMGRLGGDVPSSESMDDMGGIFAYWALRITSDYRFFFFIHSNSSVGPGEINQAFEHGSLLDVSTVAEEGAHALSHYLEYVLKNYDENRYYLS